MKIRYLSVLLFLLFIFGCGFFSDEAETENVPSSDGDVIFSKPSGFYDGSVTVALSTLDSNGTIYYTLDGSEPSLNSYSITLAGIADDYPEYVFPPANYDGGILYTSPIEITQTTLIRARVYRNGNFHGGDCYNTYFIDYSQTLPVFSLAIEPRDLYDKVTGIYVKGGADSNPDNVYYPKYASGFTGYENYLQDWEKDLHIEYFDEDNNMGFEMNAGVKIFGGWSRHNNKQQSLAIFARSKYGLSYIPYDFFGLTNNAGASINSFSSIILRNSGDDWHRTMFRDGFLQTIMEGLDVDKQAYRPAIVFLNGKYWGIHNIREKVNEDYLAHHYDYVDPDEVDILESYDSDIVEGDDEDFLEVLTFIVNNRPIDDFEYEYIKTRIDIHSFIDYCIANTYINNTDWPFSNNKYWRPRTESGKWRWIVYDTDGAFGGSAGNVATNDSIADLKSEDGDLDTGTHTATIFTALSENSTFQGEFRERYLYLLSTNFETANMQNIFNQLLGEIADEIGLPAAPYNAPGPHNEQWPDSCWDFPNTRDSFYAFIAARNAYVPTMLDAHFPP